MKGTNDLSQSTWKRPLQGGRRLAAWTLLIVGLSAITWIVLGLTNNEFQKAVSVPR